MSIEDATRECRTSSVGWHVQRLAGQLDRAMTAALQPHGLTLQQFPILMTALEFPGLTQADYGQRFQMPAYAISRAIDTLVTRQLLERRPDPESRRAHNIYPTQAAHDLAPALFALVASVNANMLAPLDDSERHALRATLARLLA